MERALEPALVDAMCAHHELVQRWAARINLTSLKDPVLAAHRHGLDCLLIADLVPEGAERAVDVGSGAGFPGVVVALARPELHVTLLEPIRKRASFLRVAATELQLPAARVRVVEGKLEPPEVSGPPRLFPADVVISRATLPPLLLIERAGPRVCPGGALVLTGGAGAPGAPEIAQAAQSAGLEHDLRRTVTLPGGETRVLDRLIRPAH